MPVTLQSGHEIVNMGTREHPQWVKFIGKIEIACDPPPGEKNSWQKPGFDYPSRQASPTPLDKRVRRFRALC